MRQGLADHLDPPVGQAALPALVEARGDPLFQQLVEGRRLQVVPAVVVRRRTVRRGDRPAEVRPEPFVPPAVQHRQVQTAVQGRLHAARPARLQGAERVVEPDVAARVQLLRHRHAVVGEEHDPVADARVVREPHQLLDQAFSAVVRRVRLARDHDLHRTLRVEQQIHQPVGVAQHQGQTFVRGDTACEADGQDVRVQDAVDPAEFGGAGCRAAARRRTGVPVPP